MAGNLDFTNLYIPLSDKITPGMPLAAAKAAGPVIAYGNFPTILVNFLIVAFCIFLVVQAVNRLKRKEALTKAPKTCRTAIRVGSAL